VPRMNLRRKKSGGERHLFRGQSREGPREKSIGGGGWGREEGLSLNQGSYAEGMPTKVGPAADVPEGAHVLEGERGPGAKHGGIGSGTSSLLDDDTLASHRAY